MLKTEVVAGGWWVGWGKNTHLTFLRDRTPTLYSAHLLHTRVILIEKSFRYPILHVPKLISLLHWFQNSFCFRSRTFPSHGGSFFGTLVDLEGENGPKKAKF